MVVVVVVVSWSEVVRNASDREKVDTRRAKSRGRESNSVAGVARRRDEAGLRSPTDMRRTLTRRLSSSRTCPE